MPWVRFQPNLAAQNNSRLTQKQSSGQLPLSQKCTHSVRSPEPSRGYPPARWLMARIPRLEAPPTAGRNGIGRLPCQVDFTIEAGNAYERECAWALWGLTDI